MRSSFYWGIRYENQSKASYNAEEINPETINSLKKRYKPHNETLAKILGRELPWKDSFVNNKLLFFLSLIIAPFSIDCLQAKDQPDFLILGVTKCGTTTLYRWMTKHPDIDARQKKELHFFDQQHLNKKGIAWYRKQFSNEKISGEASPGYFWKKDCLEKISQYCRNSKLILIFRNPVKRAISEYFRMKRMGFEKRPFDKAIEDTKMQRRYLEAGMYAKNLELWLKHFPKQQFHIMFLEEMAKNPEDELNKVFRFLELKDYRLKSYEFEPKAQYDINEVKPASINYLEALYKPHNEALAQLLGRKLPWS